jgi:hypothetical protein
MTRPSLSSWFFDAAPATRLASLRILVGLYGTLYLCIRLPHLWSYGLDDLDRFVPVGIVSWSDTPLLPALYQGVVLLTLVLSFAFLLGWRFRLLAPIYAIGLLFVLTHSNSWGKILHTDNLFVLYVACLALVPAADTYSLDARRAPASTEDIAAREVEGRYGWMIRLMCMVCAAAYLIAGIAKLRNSGFEFAQGDTLRNYVAFDNVRKLELGSVYSPIGAALLPYAGLFSGMAWVSLVLEITAPVAVVHRGFGKLWALLVWGFHVGVLALMAIGFAFQLSFVAFAPFFASERLVARVRARLQRKLGGERKVNGSLGEEVVVGSKL